MAELKPCPFCGGEVELFENNNAFLGRWYIFCPKCGIETGLYIKPEYIVEKWNRRADNG